MTIDIKPKSGVLNSPSGGIAMMFNDRFWPNGTTVKDNRILYETLAHHVPDDWIKTAEGGKR